MDRVTLFTSEVIPEKQSISRLAAGDALTRL